ncbi:DUF2336 domain-containing protein [Pelagibius sp.]|uniref:DUF2336 domain-containing protein n=1 Tax=Pelagibius sp. TaxID=1931238 RepID=UPI002608B6A2|nr:DUF2336 domain-containing protein [Pelagibius sp.]
MPPFARDQTPFPASKPANDAPDGLAEALRAATRLGDGALAPDALDHALAAFRGVLRQGDEAARRKLSEAVKTAADLPRDIVLALANDRPSVALPFIAHSPLLQEADLVKIVWSGDPVRQVTLAARPGLPAAVTSALAELAPQRVLLSLLANDSAEISGESLQSCLTRFPGDAEVQERMIGRSHLPPSVAEALLLDSAQPLQQSLLARHPVSPNAAREAQRRHGSGAPWWRRQLFSR